MSDLSRRLAKVEAALTGGRCDVCRDWPTTVVTYPNHWDPSQRANRPDGPSRCPSCNWEPQRIQVWYTTNWRAESGDTTWD